MRRGRTAPQLTLGFGPEPEAPGRRWGEDWARGQGLWPPAGIDEVGRGCLAGPVVAAAVELPEALAGILAEAGLTDSKKLTAAKREALSRRILDGARVGLGVVEAERIDSVNILRATLEAMSAAVAALVEAGGAPRCLLVDGTEPIRPDPLPGVPQRTLVQGDSRSLCVAAASVVAKVHRDALMVEHHRRWPAYGFDRHKGYPASDHQEALLRLGPTPIHRRSFAGVGGDPETLPPLLRRMGEGT